MKKYRVSRCRKCGQCRDYSTQYSIFISDILRHQTFYIITDLVPADDRIIILFHRTEVSVCRVYRSVHNCFRDCRNSLKIHISYPHRDYIESVFWRLGRKSRILSQSIHCNRIFAMSVYYFCKIISHILFSFFIKSKSFPHHAFVLSELFHIEHLIFLKMSTLP